MRVFKKKFKKYKVIKIKELKKNIQKHVFFFNLSVFN